MERLRQIGEYLKSRLSPFGTVAIYPQSKLSLTDRGELTIPIGGSARVTFKSRGRE